jgi:hypothetical protein
LKNEDGVRRLQLARQLFQMIDINWKKSLQRYNRKLPTIASATEGYKNKNVDFFWLNLHLKRNVVKTMECVILF